MTKNRYIRGRALDGPACDLRERAATVRVGAVLKTSDKGVYAKGIVLFVLDCEQGVVGVVADGRRGRGGCWGLVRENN
jgi:hypothetical protein